MVYYEWTVTAPDAGDDLIKSEKDIKESTRPRLLNFIGMTGGTAAGDSQATVSAGGKVLAQIQNTVTGDVIVTADSLRPCMNAVIPANKALEINLDVDGANNFTIGIAYTEL